MLFHIMKVCVCVCKKHMNNSNGNYSLCWDEFAKMSIQRFLLTLCSISCRPSRGPIYLHYIHKQRDSLCCVTRLKRAPAALLSFSPQHIVCKCRPLSPGKAQYNHFSNVDLRPLAFVCSVMMCDTLGLTFAIMFHFVASVDNQRSHVSHRVVWRGSGCKFPAGRTYSRRDLNLLILALLINRFATPQG